MKTTTSTTYPLLESFTPQDIRERFAWFDGEVWFVDDAGTPICPAWVNDDAALDAYLARPEVLELLKAAA